jgi:hypothetical protein
VRRHSRIEAITLVIGNISIEQRQADFLSRLIADTSEQHRTMGSRPQQCLLLADFVAEVADERGAVCRLGF